MTACSQREFWIGLLLLLTVSASMSLAEQRKPRVKKRPAKAQKEIAPKDLKFDFSTPDRPAKVSEVQGGAYPLRLRIENQRKEPVVLWPFLNVEVLDAKGKPVKRSLRIGRFGLRSADSALESVQFVTLKPGETHEIPINLKRYAYDSTTITGWTLKRGDYQLAVRYQYDPAAEKKRLGKGCKILEDPSQPWNQAVEANQSFRSSLKVR